MTEEKEETIEGYVKELKEQAKSDDLKLGQVMAQDKSFLQIIENPYYKKNFIIMLLLSVATNFPMHFALYFLDYLPGNIYVHSLYLSGADILFIPMNILFKKYSFDFQALMRIFLIFGALASSLVTLIVFKCPEDSLFYTIAAPFSVMLLYFFSVEYYNIFCFSFNHFFGPLQRGKTSGIIEISARFFGIFSSYLAPYNSSLFLLIALFGVEAILASTFELKHHTEVEKLLKDSEKVSIKSDE